MNIIGRTLSHSVMKSDIITKKAGLVYCATGPEYLKRATISAQSVKKHTPNLKCCLFTDGLVEGEVWDQVYKINKSEKGFHQYMMDKLTVLNTSPYEYTLYLDSDTYILDDISELFTVLDRFDMAICHGHDRQKRYLIQNGIIPIRGEFRKATSKSIPYAFAPVQGGLLLYRNSQKVKDFLANLIELYMEKEFYDDQVSIRELLWNSEIRFYILPPEYNFNATQVLKYWRRFGFKHAKPKIFHYTQNKYQNIEHLIASLLKNRSTDYIEK